jgi:hypothetical protein
MTHQKPWTIPALHATLPSVLAMCRSQFERDNVEAFHRIEVRRMAGEIEARRPLSQREREIAAACGYRPAREAAQCSS